MGSQIVTAAAVTAIVMSSIAPCYAASDASAVTATVSRALDALNKGDEKTWQASCGSTVTILDEFPPHAWQGPTACADWWNSFVSFAKQNRVVAGPVTLGAPKHVDITGNLAYVVYPATYSFRQSGKPMKENAIFAIVLKKSARGWLIESWSWARI